MMAMQQEFGGGSRKAQSVMGGANNPYSAADILHPRAMSGRGSNIAMTIARLSPVRLSNTKGGVV
jgi:hypothetical protein